MHDGTVVLARTHEEQGFPFELEEVIVFGMKGKRLTVDMNKDAEGDDLTNQISHTGKALGWLKISDYAQQCLVGAVKNPLVNLGISVL
jgi:hypothetical protein